MSRPTTAQIIEKGEYLDVDFDPMSLTIPQLLGLFQHHGIKYPSQHNKAKLVDLFNNDIKAHSVKLKRQRAERRGIAASDDGIIDGHTGKLLTPIEPQVPVRRSTRRVSRESTIEIARPEPPKRRRSSAQPSLGRLPGKRAVNGPPKVSEESEEEQIQERPFKSGRGDADDVASRPSTRRVSQKFGPGTEDSGWEDNNIFQSGAESSSPVRSPKAKRKTSRKSRVSMSAPPGIDSSPTRSPEGSRVKAPSQLRFDPDLPLSIRKTRLGAVPVKSEDDEEYHGDQSMDASAAYINAALWMDDEEIGDEDAPMDEFFSDKQTLEVAQRLAGDASISLTQRRQSGHLWYWTRTTFVLFVFAFLAKFCYEYKLEAEPIGYCDTGTNTNSYLENVRQQRLHELETRVSTPTNETISSLVKIPEIHPDSCTPCPAHAICTRDTVACNDGYIKRTSIFASLPYIEQFANGLPLFYPVAFPPTCVDDVIRKKNVNSIGRRIDGILAKTRGDRHCAGKGEVSAVDGGSARRWGMRVDELKEKLQKRPAGRKEDTTPVPSLSEHDFGILFAEALDQLTKLDKIIVSSDSNGYEYIASDREDLSLTCQANILLRESFAEWKRSIFGLLAFVATIFLVKAQVLARRAETQRVSELVQIALDTLRNLELAHHTDPVTTPHPYLSSLQLRDLILQDEHSVPTRRRLWDRVEAIVESNANVRVNLEEIHGGDEARVWRWVGSSGAISPRKMQYPLVSSPGAGAIERVVA